MMNVLEMHTAGIVVHFRTLEFFHPKPCPYEAFFVHRGTCKIIKSTIAYSFQLCGNSLRNQIWAWWSGAHIVLLIQSNLRVHSLLSRMHRIISNAWAHFRIWAKSWSLKLWTRMELSWLNPELVKPLIWVDHCHFTVIPNTSQHCVFTLLSMVSFYFSSFLFTLLFCYTSEALAGAFYFNF